MAEMGVTFSHSQLQHHLGAECKFNFCHILGDSQFPPMMTGMAWHVAPSVKGVVVIHREVTILILEEGASS